MEPHGSNTFALNDGAPYQPEKRLNIYDEQVLEASRPFVVDIQKFPPPTNDERSALRKVADSIPAVSYWLWDTTDCGGLGRGEQLTNAFVLLFAFLSYSVPIYGGYVANVQLGRYKTIMIGVLFCGVAHVILIGGAAPSALQGGKGIAPFPISFFMLAFGAGSGEKVIMVPEATVQRIMLIFYGLNNVGAFFALATTNCEKDVGYWLAYLIPHIVKKAPDGSVLTNVFKITGMAIKQNKFKLWGNDYFNAAIPSVLAAKGITTFNGKPISWTDKLVDDTARTYAACTVFPYFPIWYNNDGGI
ncbi:hypothetical protein MMC11_002582 [Xylographa trunciseda]|nr:hypothetical protein [Xylographa trunciseda]